MPRPDITTADKRREAERELAMRRKVYPRMVETGRMKKHEAERQIAVMEAIAADYQERGLPFGDRRPE
mgnify:FL=1